MNSPSTSINGLLVVDKPSGLTSRDVVNRALGWFPRRTRLGHTGTLDPLATGVLVLCAGTATRLAEFVQDLPKTYETMLRLGARSDTDDANGTIEPVANAIVPDRDAIERHVASFIGEIEQVPPAYSAAKVEGHRSYHLARRGDSVELAPRRVRIDRIDVLGCSDAELRLRIQCGKGTYVRSIARDLGEKLGCGAYVAELRRTRVGCFDLQQAITLDVPATEAHGHLLPAAAAVAHLPRIDVSDESARRLRFGQSVGLPPSVSPTSDEVAVFDPRGELVGIAKCAGAHLVPTKIIPA